MIYKNRHKISLEPTLQEIKYLVPLVNEVRRRRFAAILIQKIFRGFNERKWNEYYILDSVLDTDTEYDAEYNADDNNIDNDFYAKYDLLLHSFNDLTQANHMLSEHICDLKKNLKKINTDIYEIHYNLSYATDKMDSIEDEITYIHNRIDEIN